MDDLVLHQWSLLCMNELEDVQWEFCTVQENKPYVTKPNKHWKPRQSRRMADWNWLNGAIETGQGHCQSVPLIARKFKILQVEV